MSRSLEHHVLEKVGEPRPSGFLMGRSHMRPHIARDDRNRMVLMEDHLEPVREGKSLKLHAELRWCERENEKRRQDRRRDLGCHMDTAGTCMNRASGTWVESNAELLSVIPTCFGSGALYEAVIPTCFGSGALYEAVIPTCFRSGPFSRFSPPPNPRP